MTGESNPYVSPATETDSSGSRDVKRALGGWLYVLLVYLVLAQPIGAVQFLARMWPVEAPYTHAEAVLHSTTMSARALLGIVVAGLIYFCRTHGTLLISRAYLFLMMLLPLASYAFHVLVLGGPLEQRWNPGAFIVPGLWYAYLTFSRRASETFVPEAQEAR